MSTAAKLFKRAAVYLDLIDNIAPIASKHEYTFVSSEYYTQRLNSNPFTIEERNFIIALELIEKAHLASVTALLRARRWADATCLMYEKENFVGCAADPQHAFPGQGQMKPEQLEIAQLKREVIKLKAERDILKRPTSRRNRREVRFHCEAPEDLAGGLVVRGARCLAGWLLYLADTTAQPAQPER
jgi:hypothetical protein